MTRIERTPKRGEIWWVDFEPAVGNEQRKLRPAVVLSPDSVGRLPLHIAVPITDWKPSFAQAPWFTELTPTPDNGLTKHGGADGFQVKSLDRSRFTRFAGVLTAEQVEDVAATVALCIGFCG